MNTLLLSTLLCAWSVTPELHVQSLEVADPIWDIAVEDINNDGHMDLFLLTCDSDREPMRKQVHSYLGRGEGRFAETPDDTLSLAPEASALFFASLTPETPTALLAGDNQGFQTYHFEDNQFTAAGRIALPSLIPASAREPLFLVDIVRDWTGDGRETWLLPQNNGYSLHRGEEQVALIECDVISQIRQNGNSSISYHLPEYTVFDIADAPNPAIAFMYEEEIEFAYGPGWKQRHRIPILGKHHEHRSYSNMRDINGDGLPDIVVTEMEGTVSMDSTTRVYLAHEPFVYPTSPSTVLENSGSIAAPLFYDLAGNDAEDAIMVSVPFGPRNLMNYFFRKRLRLDVEAYRFDTDGFESTPFLSTSLGMDAPEGHGSAMYAMGDFVGNGLMDMAYAESADSLAIHLGKNDDLIPDSPWKTVTLPTTMGEVRTYDLTGNDGEDLVLMHPDSAHSGTIQVITFVTQ